MKEITKTEKNTNQTRGLLQPPKVGEMIEGEIIGIGKSAVYLNLGAFGTGIIYGREFKEAKETLKDVEEGSKITAKITNLETEEGYVELSLKEARQEIAWEKIEQKKKNSEPIKVIVDSANKGGLIAKVFGIQAFLPVSQLSPTHYPRVEDGDPSKILNKLQEFVGEELEVKIIDFSQKDNKLIISEKAKTAEKTEEILEKYEEGQVVEGEITAVLNFGAFIKFGKENLEGLIHISELDWKLVKDPSEIVDAGDKVEAKIINIEKDRVFLSLKALKENPWEDIEKEYKKGDEVEGKVAEFKPFGALIKITPKIQGLIHISEFGSQEEMKSKLKEGKDYKFKINAINPSEHKIILELANKS
jgi:small subunit ribosomal protein S1